MTENDRRQQETRFDLQEMLKDLESEGVGASPALKNVQQADIAQLFKKKSPAGTDGKPQ